MASAAISTAQNQTMVVSGVCLFPVAGLSDRCRVVSPDDFDMVPSSWIHPIGDIILHSEAVHALESLV